MITNTLQKRAEQVRQLSETSKFRRFLKHPARYVDAILFQKIIYPATKKSKSAEATTFWGKKMFLRLPAGTDIYLTGGKSHPSELNLANFLITHLARGNFFIDIGAHFGYFSLLAAELVGAKGQVYSFEASPITFEVLSKNCRLTPWINIFNQAVADRNTPLVLYQFPDLYSEFNTLEVEQFENESWFKKYPPTTVSIDTVILSDFFEKEKIIPDFIKIDVEGAEDKVIRGVLPFLKQHSPTIIMEFLSSKRGNAVHLEAEQMLKENGYSSHIIRPDGTLKSIGEVAAYFSRERLESDNIVFCKDIS